MGSVAKLQERIQSLQRQLHGPHAAANEEAEPSTLDERLTALRSRISRRLTTPGDDSQQTTQRPDETPTNLKLTLRSQQIQAILKSHQQAVSNIADAARQDPKLSTVVDGAVALARLGLQTLESVSASVDLQLQAAPALEEICSRLQDLTRTLQGSVAASQQQTGRLEAMHEVLQESVDDGRLDGQKLAVLSRELIAGIDESFYPPLIASGAMTALDQVCRHALNCAGVVAYLTSRDVRWRAHRESMVTAALAMDVGMLKLEDSVLTLNGALTDKQRADVERHPLLGGLMLEQLDGLDAQFAEAAACHHERLDGSGYPHGKKGDEISAPARVLAVADVLTARQEQRSYRTAQLQRQALTKTLWEAEENKLDSQWAKELVNLGLYPVGSVVELSTGEIAEVVAGNIASEDPSLAALPVVQLLADRTGRRRSTAVYRNLAHRPDCRVVRQLTASEAGRYQAR